MLRWLGHERVALLDGGFPAWEKQGRPVTKDVPAARKGEFVPSPQLGATVDAHHQVQEPHRGAAVEALRSAINPETDVQATAAYRRHLAGVLLERALPRACERARQGAIR